MENWITTDEADDVAGSIRHALLSFDATSKDDHAWKWVALSLHSALQGACICHLTTSASPLGAVTKRNTAEWLNYFEISRSDPSAKAPETFLMPLPDLLKKVRQPHSAGDRSNEIGIIISDQELVWLRDFHDGIRNQFTHFEPMSWSIEISGIPRLAELAARIITEILGLGYAFRHKEREWKQEISNNLSLMSKLA